MEYVMVPVPEELEEEVRQYLHWNVMLPAEPVENPRAVEDVYGEIGGNLRHLLHRVAQLTADGITPRLTEVAEELSITTHEAVGLCHDLNARLRNAGGPSMFVVPQFDTDEKPEGRSAFDHRVLTMSSLIADRILRA